ncbi:hypothetical protein SNE510_58950 [Streptomyces sp. NE5-10]|uniref:STAS domain-containing protein n=1 Tax=Streptomyces sp. NE5-10 TaxID=2759674 RepID=UPI001904C573|nr:STAS domain-containing protein [Streptomyces sp. NE5-10]GHJ96376.1 hypothetical protein SNE510_58950 [Streptomyces sp. NE5-10]
MQLIPRHDPHLAVRTAGALTVAVLRGELDLVLVRHLRPELDALVREADALAVDVRALGFCDATGLGLLAHCARSTRGRGAHFQFVCDQPWILRLVRLTGLDDLLRPEPVLRPLPSPALAVPPPSSGPRARAEHPV